MIQFVSIQMASPDGESFDKRIQRANRILKDLYESGVRPAQILFPEIWATGFFSFDQYILQAEPVRGPIYEMMSEWSRRFGAYIHTGSFVEKDGEDYYNTSLLLDPHGDIIGRYRKIHLFGYQSKETALLTPGTEAIVVKTDYGMAGMATCYDLRFPELFRTMVDLEAEYTLVASAWPMARLGHWQLFNRVRALENQCFLISCNGAGVQHGTTLAGHSSIVDPNGQLIKAGKESEEILIADIDPKHLHSCRTDFPVLKDRKRL